YGIGIGVGCLMAFLTAPLVRRSFASGAESRAHTAAPYVPPASALNAVLAEFMQALEQGTTTAEGIAAVTEKLLPCIVVEDGDPASERHMGLQSDGAIIGDLRMPPPEAGRRDWIFELKLAPLPRYGAAGGPADLAITFSGQDGVIHFVSALVQTHVHVSKVPIETIAAEPLLIGGGYRVDESS